MIGTLGHVLAVLWVATPPGEVGPPPAPTEAAALEVPVEVPPPPATVPAEPPAEAASTPSFQAGPASSRMADTRIYIWGIGVGLAARWGRHGSEEATQPKTLLLTTVQARLVGYASSEPRLGGGRRLVLSDLSLSLDVGESLAPNVKTIGVQGALRLGIGRSLASRVSPYGKLQVDPRFAGFAGDIAEGNFVSGALRGSGGLLARTGDESFVLMAGAVVDGVAGAQRLGPRSSFAQVMTGGEWMMVARPGEDLALMLVGDVRATLLGERSGGRRVEGRASLELGYGNMSVFLAYTGMRIQADIPVGPGATLHERRGGHALQFGFGFGL